MTKTDLRVRVNTVKSKNRISGLLLPVSDWVDSLIGPSGLLLVILPPTLRSQFQFYGWGGVG
jgi:hypothetical protein